MTLKYFFQEHPRAAIAFSGGVDSAYLLYAAKRWGREVKAYYVKTSFQPQFELEDARRLADTLGADMEVIELNILNDDTVTSNPPDRCYHCKKNLFGHILEHAKNDGFFLVLDGTNASDDASDRPGMQALRELSVRSPLRECGLTKAVIRQLSKEAGLFTWDKPAYACLATRFPTEERITAYRLERTERAEAYLMSLGLRDFRVRSVGDVAKIQVTAQDFAAISRERTAILQELRQYYASVTLDLEVRNEQ